MYWTAPSPSWTRSFATETSGSSLLPASPAPPFPTSFALPFT
eukprot:CAMPEP_0195134306 /NCGR_PEP_ID=MMETSP0448-20130528/150380_1 /TAXON_ID=66468 /ORGANISM="Heterocapsa triquestra, Strain CCMP 448" /LENGTH=41 /DNA_ID= /DNA_START= /DNA_END= /DNA_ORIENTATION=